MYIWTPPPGILDRVRDSVGDTWSTSCVVIGDPEVEYTDPATNEIVPHPDPNEFTVDGLDPVFDFSYSGNVFTVSTDSLLSVFPIQIEYKDTRESDVVISVSKWDDIPKSANEVISVRTLSSSPYISTFSVTASYNGELIETASYSIEVIHVYDSTRDALKAQINERTQ